MRYTEEYLTNNLPIETGGMCSKEKIQQVENLLGVTLPKSYASFLDKYSFLTYDGRTVLGVSEDFDESVVYMTQTINQQIKTFPSEAIVIESLGFDNLFVLLKQDGKIYQYDLFQETLIYDSFYDYLMRDVLDAKNTEINDRVKAISNVVIEQYGYHKDWVKYEYLRILKFYRYAFDLCYEFVPEELEVISEEILRVEYELLNNSLETIQNIESYSKQECFMCFLDIAYILSKQQSYLSKYLREVIKEINADNKQEEDLKEKILSLLESK